MWNWFCVLALWNALPDNTSFGEVLWASIWVMMGGYGAWAFWYRNLYFSLRDSTTFTHLRHLFWFFGHFLFCATMELGMSGTASGCVYGFHFILFVLFLIFFSAVTFTLNYSLSRLSPRLQRYAEHDRLLFKGGAQDWNHGLVLYCHVGLQFARHTVRGSANVADLEVGACALCRLLHL